LIAKVIIGLAKEGERDAGPRISSIPVTRRRHSDNEQKNRDAQASGHFSGPEDIASMSAAFEAALGQLGLIERNDLATMACERRRAGFARRLGIEADIKVSRPHNLRPFNYFLGSFTQVKSPIAFAAGTGCCHRD
jgi:hypothetical protein